MYISFDEGNISLILVRADMRCGFDKLAVVAQTYLGIDVNAGNDWVIFVSKSGHVAKIIHADKQGSLLITRKLHQGCFQKLMSKIEAPAVKKLTKRELESYLDGEEIECYRTNLLKG